MAGARKKTTPPSPAPTADDIAKANAFKTIGSTGLASWSGAYQGDGERAPELQGSQRYTTFYNTMLNTSIVAAGVRYFLNLVSKAGWKVEPAEMDDEADQARAEEAAELVEACMYDMTTPWTRVVRKAAIYRLYGFSLQEWTAKRRADGSIGILDVESRPQHTVSKWDLDDGGTVKGIWQETKGGTGPEVYIPRRKLIYALDDTLSSSPEGVGLLRHVIKHVSRLSAYETLEGYGFEGDLRGNLVATAPFAEINRLKSMGLLTDAEASKATEDIVAFARAHYKTPQRAIVIDSGVYRADDDNRTPSGNRHFGLELLNANVTSQSEMAAAIERLNREIARVLGVEGLLLGNGQGSQALSRDKSHSFGLLVESALGELTEVYESDYAKTILRLNGIEDRFCPTLKTDAIQYREVEQITAALVDLSTAGAPLSPDDPAIDEVRSLLGLSRAPKLDEVLLQQEELREEFGALPGDPPPELNEGDDELDDDEPATDDEEEIPEDDEAKKPKPKPTRKRRRTRRTKP